MDGNGDAVEILVVDDSREVGEAMADLLSGEGYRCRYVDGGRAALAAVRERRPALVLTDAFMPGMTGLELITALRSEVAPPVPPVIVVSGFPALEPEARARGAVDFLHKPVDSEEMLAAVARVLARRPVDRAASELARLRVWRERQQISRTAAAALAAVERAGEEIARPAQQLAAWLSRYFGFGTATVVACPAGAIRVLAEVRAPGALALPNRSVADAFFHDIAETGSSLLIADTEAYAALAPLANEGGIRFFAGVPVLVDGTSVGALALLDRRPQPFGGGDLALLEHVGRRAGARLLAHVEGPDQIMPEPVLDEVGRLNPASFEAFLSTELRLAGQNGASFALAMVDLKELPARLPPPGDDGDGVRLAIGRLGPHRLAAFKRHDSVAQATAVLDAVIAGTDRPAVTRAAVLALEARAVALLSGRVAMDIAENGVVTTRGRGVTTHLCLTVEAESTSAPVSVPSER